MVTDSDHSVSASYPSLLPTASRATEPENTHSVLDVPISSLTMNEAIARVNRWIKEDKCTRLVTFTNVHMIVEAHVRPGFRKLLHAMDMNCPDGAPIFWLARRKMPRTEKISGPDFMPLFCEHSVAWGHRHFFYGGAPGVASSTAAALRERYPGIQIAGYYCPPFRDLSSYETEAVVHMINESEADVVWVCLGCPRQETWMGEQRDRLNAKVLLAVGQAFDIISGRTSRAPVVVRGLGLEWLYRLCQEPRRLWKRYLVTNLLFTLLLLRDKVERELA